MLDLIILYYNLLRLEERVCITRIAPELLHRLRYQKVNRR